jgi:hypothetical protein
MLLCARRLSHSNGIFVGGSHQGVRPLMLGLYWISQTFVADTEGHTLVMDRDRLLQLRSINQCESPRLGGARD